MEKADDFPTYYVRHAKELDVDRMTWEKLKSRDIIALRFPRDKYGKLGSEDNDNDDHSAYFGNDRTAMKNFNELACEGGYVCAEYYGFDGCVVGFVEPGTKIEKIPGHWAEDGQHPGRKAVLRSLRLTLQKEFRQPSSLGVLLGSPPYVTISRWNSVKNRIANIVNGRPPEPVLDSLSDYQQEVMVSEFLRSQDAVTFGLPRVSSLLTPVGRTMRDVDVVGLSENGSLTFAQVTFKNLKNSKSKVASLRKCSASDNLLFFCQCAEKTVQGNLTIFPLRQVFDAFTRTPAGQQWLQQALEWIYPRRT